MRKALLILTVSGFLFMIFESCQKSMEHPTKEGVSTGKKPKNTNPPPPPPFYFTNCYNNEIYPATGNIKAGIATSVNFTLNYVNSPGGSYPAYTSPTINGLTITTPAGTLTTGSGSITFNLSGTPTAAGYCTIPAGIAGTTACGLIVTVVNQPANPATCGGEPGAAIGSTGCVTFTYRGQTVTYSTVRAADGKVWLQQNLGSPQVAMNAFDHTSYGDLFQWGRWDDGHQLRNSPIIPGSPSLMNPSHIPGGNPNFIGGSTTSTQWWSNGLSTDTWNGTEATSTNGKNPCAVLGAGWRMPSIGEWQTVTTAEGITSSLDAYDSRLKLPSPGTRFFANNDGNYWSSTASSNGNGYFLFFDQNNYEVFFWTYPRSTGMACRCVKD